MFFLIPLALSLFAWAVGIWLESIPYLVLASMMTIITYVIFRLELDAWIERLNQKKEHKRW